MNYRKVNLYIGLKKNAQNLVKCLVQWRYLLLLILCFSLSLSQPFLLAQGSSTRPIAQSQQNGSDLIQRAKTFYQSEQFEQSAQIWQQSADVFAAQGDRLNQAMALSNLSLSSQKLGRWDQAAQATTQSLSLLKAHKATPTQQKVLAATLDIQGQLQRETGQSQNALKTWQQAEGIYKKNADNNGAVASQINQAQALQDLGLYPRACQTVMNSLGLEYKGCEVTDSALQTLNEKQPKPLQILGLRSLGNILRIIGQTQQSQIVLHKSWKLAQETGDTQSLSAIYLSLGNTARALGNKAVLTEQRLASLGSLPPLDCASITTTATASEFYRQASTCYQNAQANAPASLAIQAQLNLVNLSVQSQQWAVIPDLLPKIQTQLTQLPPSHSSISAQLKLAQSLMCLQDGLNPNPSAFPTPLLQSCGPNASGIEQVRSHISSWPAIQSLVNGTLKQSQTLGDRQAEANALGYLAGIAQQTGNLTEAQHLTEQALQKISAFSEPELAYLWQWQLGRLYQLQEKPKEAIAAYSLSFSTLQSLRRELVATDSDIQFTFRESVEPVYRELVDLHLQGQTPSQNSLKQARDVTESLQLAELNNFFREACIESRTKPIDRLDPKAAIIYGIILPKRLAVIVSLPGNKPLQYYETPLQSSGQGASSGQIERTVEDLFATLNPYVSTPDALKPSQKIYDWLVRPVEADLKASDTKTLVFVLDGVLRGVPVAALHDGQRYLIESYGLALTPGLQLLSSQSLTSQKLKILLGGLAEARQGFSSLPGVQQEITDIAGVVPTSVLLNDNFTRTRIQAAIDANPFPIIHLATHAQFSSRAEDTFLLTWDERINVKNLDQFLRERNRLGRKPIELLILSACQTAVGDKRAALGLAGVAVRSGARSTLATLWSVQDQSTADLMTKFYGALNQSGSTKADALRQAQIALMKSSQYEHPFYWAPFVLVGNWL